MKKFKKRTKRKRNGARKTSKANSRAMTASRPSPAIRAIDLEVHGLFAMLCVIQAAKRAQRERESEQPTQN